MSQSSTVSQVFQVQTALGTLHGNRHGRADDRPPLLFLQGFAAPPEIWAPVIARLHGERECITVDWPFGAHQNPLRPGVPVSPPVLAETVAELLEQLGLEQAVLVGNDSGGVIAQLVISDYPNRVAAAALVSCDAFEYFPPPGYRILFRLAKVPGVVRGMAMLLSTPSTSRSRFGYGSVITSPAHCYRWARALRADPRIRRDAARLMSSSSRSQTQRAAETFASFHQPVTVVWAANDRLFPRELGERLSAAFPNSQFRVAENSRTFVPADQPEQLAQFIAELLDRAS